LRPGINRPYRDAQLIFIVPRAPDFAGYRNVRPMAMMMPVIGSPPEHTFLGRSLSEKGQKKLSYSSRPKGSMTEIAMVPSRYRKHANHIGDGE